MRHRRLRDAPKDATLKSHRYKIDAKLDKLLAVSLTSAAGRKFVKAIKQCRGDIFVFLERRNLPSTNSKHRARPGDGVRRAGSERHLRACRIIAALDLPRFSGETVSQFVALFSNWIGLR